MRIVAGINRLVLIIMDTLRQLFTWRIWVVLVGYYALQWLVLYAHYQFMSPAFGWLSSITLSFQDPQRAVAFSHYPAHLILLPGVFGWAKLGLGVLLEGLVLGIVATEFSRKFAGPGRTPGGSIINIWLNLAVVWIVINALAVALGEFVPSMLASKLYSPKRIAAFTFVLMPALFTICTALFFYAIPIVVTTRKNAFVALGQAAGYCFRNPFTTLVLTVLVVTGPVLIAAITGAYATTIVEKFRPELIYWLMVVGIAVEMISAFFWIGFATRLVTDSSD